MMRRAFWFILAGLLLAPSVTLAGSAGQTTRLFMPDGQLKSHTVRVYVTHDISPNQQPKLMLLRSHSVTKKAVNEAAQIEPGIVAPRQEWLERIGGKEVRRTGTLLLFDLSTLKFSCKAMMRVMPVISWTDGGMEHIVVSSREVNLGNIVAATGWTALVVGIVVLLIIFLSWRNKGNPLQLLTGVEGQLSLSKTQVAGWTVVVGGVVLGYSMVKSEVPEIPTSLLALMGASLVTGGVGYFRDTKQLQAATAGGSQTPTTPKLVDLLRAFTPGQVPKLSLAKAQMLFWTLLIIVIFLSKSILNGAIWDVPWPLVALMGFSQAGYLAPKLSL
jgi:hypothetical protein